VELVSEGHVRVNGQKAEAPGRGIKRGDVLTLALVRTVALVRVVDFAERRGSAEVARKLYELLSPIDPSIGEE
jgi:ribosome-associated heat shock protein Hsp15